MARHSYSSKTQHQARRSWIGHQWRTPRLSIHSAPLTISPRSKQDKMLQAFWWKTLVVLLGIWVFLSQHPSQLAGFLPRPSGASVVPIPAEQRSYPGMGAGNALTMPMDQHAPEGSFDSSCTDDLLKDATCWMQHRISDIVGWTVHGIYDPLYPFLQMFFNSPANIIYQTPKEVTYDNETVKTWTANIQVIATAAFGALVAIGTVHYLLTRHTGLRTTELPEIILRAIFAFIASQCSLFFVQCLIDCNNNLSEFMWGKAQLTFLQSVVTSLFTFDLFKDGWVLVILSLLLGLLAFLLLWQMFVRIVMLIFLIVMAPLGLLCFAFVVTETWGKLWLKNFMMTLFVQFFQVSLLTLGCALGTQLLSDTGDHLWKFFLPSLFKDPLNLIGLLMAVICFYLAIKLPGMLRDWMFSAPSAAAGNVALGAAAGVGNEVGERAGEAAKSVLANAAMLFL